MTAFVPSVARLLRAALDTMLRNEHGHGEEDVEEGRELRWARRTGRITPADVTQSVQA